MRCDMCACLRPCCCVAMCSLYNNDIGPEGAAAISRSLASVPQLQTLKYVCCGAVCTCVGGADVAAGPRGARGVGRGLVDAGCQCQCAGQGVWAWELGCLCGCGATCVHGWLRLWCRVALCSLERNRIGPEGAAAISCGLASVPQLQTLEYVVAVCALVVPLRRQDPVAQGVRGCGASVRAECVGVRCV